MTNSSSRGNIQLTAEMIHGFVAGVLLSSFDAPKPIPQCHMEWWKVATDPHENVAIAAPRGHAKTTAITHSFVLAAMLFRYRDHAMILSDTEDQACAFLGDIKMELEENETLRDLFNVDKFLKDRESEVIVQMVDGYRFRIIARGSNQKLRGLKWRHKRPNLIIGDDLENDEMVMNQDRRAKFREWFMGALLPAGSDDCIFRIVGTILHLDSMLERLMPPLGHKSTVVDDLRQSTEGQHRAWKSYRYKAHNEDFSKILWPDKFPEKRLKSIRQKYMEQGFPEGYSQEYLNYPIDDSTAYFKKSDFRNKFSLEELTIPLEFYTGVDFAISKRERADYTAMVTVGVDSENKMYLVDVRRGRWDAKEIIDKIFDIRLEFNPELFIMEKGAIERSLGPFLKDEQFKRNLFINSELMNPGVGDKRARAKSIQARMRQGGILFDPEQPWYSEFEEEMRTFDRGAHDDMVDAISWIGLKLDKIVEGPTQQELEDQEWDEFYEEHEHEGLGICAVTGY